MVVDTYIQLVIEQEHEKPVLERQLERPSRPHAPLPVLSLREPLPLVIMIPRFYLFTNGIELRYF
jgi:hypothetical protein